MKIFVVLCAVLMSGCASLTGGTANNAQPVNVLMQVMATASAFSVNGCIPPIAATDPAVACAPITSTDPAAINAAFNACLAATATQMLLANVKVPKCQTVPVVVVQPSGPK